MAKLETSTFLKQISGKIDSSERTAYRYRYGKQEAYHYKKTKRTKATQRQKLSREQFDKINKISSIINKDEQLSAPFLALYKKLPAGKRPQILFRFIVSELSLNPDLLAQHEHLLNQNPII